MKLGAIILCGGKSSRMGRDKGGLPFGPGETMLQRVLRLVAEAAAVEQVVCVAAPDQQLPALRGNARVVRDERPHRGPLAGLAAGIAALADGSDAAFATGCDAPLLVPAFIGRMFELLDGHDIAAPHDGMRWHPLAGVYRTEIGPQLEEMMARGERSLIALLEACKTRRVATDELRDVDPQLASLVACNTLDEYRGALRRAGFEGAAATWR